MLDCQLWWSIQETHSKTQHMFTVWPLMEKYTSRKQRTHFRGSLATDFLMDMLFIPGFGSVHGVMESHQGRSAGPDNNSSVSHLGKRNQRWARLWSLVRCRSVGIQCVSLKLLDEETLPSLEVSLEEELHRPSTTEQFDERLLLLLYPDVPH